LPLPAFRGDWDIRPDHKNTMRFPSESGKRKIAWKGCG
jgi:hypothetical protein